MFKITIISVGSMKEKYFADYSLENVRFSSGVRSQGSRLTQPFATCKEF